MNRIEKNISVMLGFYFILYGVFRDEKDRIENRFGFRVEWLKSLEIMDFGFWGKVFLLESWLNS